MPDASPEALFAVLMEVGIINQISTSFLEAALPDGLIAAHFAVVSHLIRVGDGQTPVEIARALQVPKTSFSNTLAGLEKRHLVEARPNPKDGRSKTVWVTEAGRALYRDTILALGPMMAELAQRLQAGSVETMLPPLRELRVEMDKMRDA